MRNLEKEDEEDTSGPMTVFVWTALILMILGVVGC